MSRAFRAIRLAIAFLTVVRVPVEEREVTPESLADARFAYPLVGLLIGVTLTGINEFFRQASLPRPLSAFWLTAILALVSGGLHLDGLADSADGLFLRGDRERRLAAMRDSHVGSFGVIALILVLLGKHAALETMGDSRRSLVILAACVVSRALIGFASGLAGYARAEGTGRLVVESTTKGESLTAAVLILLVGVILAGWVGLAASVVALISSLGFVLAARAKLGGITGDILGAVVEAGELWFLMIMATQAV